METTLISVIVPVYNVAQYLEKSIASIQQQTYQNLEIILVDDGSTDEAVACVNKLLSKMNEFWFITRKMKLVSSSK